jgi:hypothetical protein
LEEERWVGLMAAVSANLEQPAGKRPKNPAFKYVLML